LNKTNTSTRSGVVISSVAEVSTRFQEKLLFLLLRLTRLTCVTSGRQQKG